MNPLEKRIAELEAQVQLLLKMAGLNSPSKPATKSHQIRQNFRRKLLKLNK